MDLVAKNGITLLSYSLGLRSQRSLTELKSPRGQGRVLSESLRGLFPFLFQLLEPARVCTRGPSSPAVAWGVLLTSHHSATDSASILSFKNSCDDVGPP